MKRDINQPLLYKFSELASHITGLSLPVFGVSWQAPEAERTIVRSVLIFLEDRRALYNPFAIEMEHEVTDSVLEIRKELTDAIQRLSDKSAAVAPLQAMRVACREYLDNTRQRYGPHFAFMADLGRLRTIFGYHLAQLAVMYGLDIEGELASIIPPEYTQDIDKD